MLNNLYTFLFALILFGSGMNSICRAEAKGPETTNLQFRNKNDLINYLNQLNELYAIAGRPRFGREDEEDDDNDEINENGSEFFNDNIKTKFGLRDLIQKRKYISKNKFRKYF